MKKVIALSSALLSTVIIIGCAPANVSMDIRDPSSDEPSMQTRCLDFETGDENIINSMLKEYDGWKVVYASEYTTGNKATTSMVMCFERPYSG